jgi:poly(hydroxyalkanoate) depolymerase family esterase
VPMVRQSSHPPIVEDTSPRAPAQRKTDSINVGQFLTLSHVNGKGSRGYKLFIPSAYADKPLPLVVMLHGCKQNPDDFARGTRMNALAQQHGFMVAYPAQTARNNGANCWNWFERHEQHREGVEPSLIAGIVNDIGSAYAVDESRVFVAGLSAGAAMAVILGATYPDVFSAVAAHSGLPVGAAHDVASAFAAMQGRNAPTAAAGNRFAVPTLVIHGDADHTVASSNGATIVDQAIKQFSASNTPLQKNQRSNELRNGKRYSATEYTDIYGNNRVEEWVVHGGAHNWFGGSAEGSYTDPLGPDASAEIVRFFLAQKPQSM